MTQKASLSFADIQEAEKNIQPYVKKTPLSRSSHFSKRVGVNVFFKWETDQEIKSFKIRGALNKILSLTESEKSAGLITASAGNHAQGVAQAARLMSLKSRVVMMEKASKLKVSETKRLGAQVILKGKTYDESYEYAQSIKGDSVFVHPFADPKIIAGQGTVGLEIYKDLPQADSVIVSVGGGGLLSGLSLALKSLNPAVKVYGVVWEGTSDFCRKFNKIPESSLCLCQKKIPRQFSKSGLTDGIAVRKSFSEIVKICSRYVEGVSCVSEREISQCILEIREHENKIVEGSGAAALTGLLKHHTKWDLGKNCCVVVSGANIDKEALFQLARLNPSKPLS